MFVVEADRDGKPVLGAGVLELLELERKVLEELVLPGPPEPP